MENGITLHTAELDGKRLAYSSESVFKVQVGNGRKGSYKTKYSIKGNFGQAFMLYRGINIGYGFKKRLVCDSFNKPLIARLGLFPS